MATYVITGRNVRLNITGWGTTALDEQTTSAVLTKTNDRQVFQTLLAENYKTTNTEATFDLEMKVLNTYPEEYDRFPFMIKKLCREENQDLSFLYKMLDMLEDVNNGNKSLASVEYTLGEELASKYLYPAINKKTDK